MLKFNLIDENYLSDVQIKNLNKKYKFNQGPFFYPEIMLAPYGNERRTKGNTFVVIGSKNTGKTTNMIRYALKRAIANRKIGQGRFVLVRRSGKERINYWHEGSATGKGWPNCICKKDNIYGVDPKTEERFLVAKLESISGSGIGRGVENPGFDTLIFDDFIGLQGERRISGFSKRLEPMISNYFRDNIQHGLVILIGNNDRLDAEWLIENNFQIPTSGGCFELKRQHSDKSLKTIMYVEGVNTKQGIISTHLKDFDESCLAGASEMSLEYLYSNQCMVIDENVLDLKYGSGPDKREHKYQFSIDNTYCIIEQGFYFEPHKDLENNDKKLVWLCYTVNKTQLDLTKPVHALTVNDKLKTTAIISDSVRSLGEGIGDLFNQGSIGFTNPLIKEKLLKGANRGVTTKFITDF